MNWTIISLIAEAAAAAWAFLVYFRVIGKPPGKDPAFDKYMEQTGVVYKFGGIFGVLAVVFTLASLVLMQF